MPHPTPGPSNIFSGRNECMTGDWVPLVTKERGTCAPADANFLF